MDSQTTTAPAPTAPVRAAWDTRCVRGCGAVVLEHGQTCTPCTLTEVDAESDRIIAAVRREWAWVLEWEAKR